jgi:hypothetical protein
MRVKAGFLICGSLADRKLADMLWRELKTAAELLQRSEASLRLRFTPESKPDQAGET